MILVCFSNSIANSVENTSIYFKSSAGISIRGSLNIKVLLCISLLRQIGVADNATTKTIKVSAFLFKTVAANFLFLISSILLVMSRAVAVVWFLQISLSNSKNYTFALLNKRKNIFRITSMLMSATKQVSLKNQTHPNLSLRQKTAKTILCVPKIHSSIF